MTLRDDLTIRPDGPAADSRDMVAVHDMFRRQFKALPDLLASAPQDRPDDVRVVTAHAQFLITLLHAHHDGEDVIAWPRIEARGGDEPRALAETMTLQHEQIDAALTHLATAVADLAAHPSRAGAIVAADAARSALEIVQEHLALEEARVLVLIDHYLTQEEWAAVAGHGMENLDESMFPVMFGMLLEDMSPRMYDIFSAAIPEPVIGPMTAAGPPAYAQYLSQLQAAIA